MVVTASNQIGVQVSSELVVPGLPHPQMQSVPSLPEEPLGAILHRLVSRKHGQCDEVSLDCESMRRVSSTMEKLDFPRCAGLSWPVRVDPLVLSGSRARIILLTLFSCAVVPCSLRCQRGAKFFQGSRGDLRAPEAVRR